MMGTPIPYGFCHCGCGEHTKKAPLTRPGRGWIKNEPMRYLKGHGARAGFTQYTVEDTGYETPCWIWQRAKTPRGYGQLVDNGRTQSAYRVYYERRFGAVPSGLCLDHLCRIHACVNPDHLEPVTTAINTQRGNVAKLTQAMADAIRSDTTTPARLLARRHTVSPHTIRAIRRGDSWNVDSSRNQRRNQQYTRPAVAK